MVIKLPSRKGVLKRHKALYSVDCGACRQNFQCKVIVQYNGNEKAFDFFMESMINEFLNSCSIAKAEQNDFIDNVEIIEKSS